MANLLTDASNEGTDWLLKLPQSEAMVASRPEPGPSGLAARRSMPAMRHSATPTRPGDQSFAWYRGPLLLVRDHSLPRCRPTEDRRRGARLRRCERSVRRVLCGGLPDRAPRRAVDKSFSIALLDWWWSLNRKVDVPLDRLASPHWRRLSGDDRAVTEMSGDDVAENPRAPATHPDPVPAARDAPARSAGAATRALRTTLRRGPDREHGAVARPRRRDHAGDDESGRRRTHPARAAAGGCRRLPGGTRAVRGRAVQQPRARRGMLPKESLRCFYVDSNWLHASSTVPSAWAHTPRAMPR